METPATTRRNPPRKAKLTSAEKSTVKEYRSTRKRYVADAKALMPSFTAEAEDRRLKPSEEACPIETLQGGTLLASAQSPKVAGNCASHQSVSAHTMHTCGAESYEHDHSALKSTSSPTQAAEQQNSLKDSAEKISTSAMVGFEAEDPQCEAPFVSQSKKQPSSKLRVFLRIRPAQVVRAGKRHTSKVQKASEILNRSSQQGIRPPAGTMMALNVPDVCLLSQTPDCVTLIAPTRYLGSHKLHAEDFNGFSCIFKPESTQKDIFDEVLAPRLSDLLEGESSLVVAMGPTSAGKTHTMLGSPRDPGLVPRSLAYLFASDKLKNVSASMKIVISMFEIYSEQGGRPEKILDLLQDGAELSLQQSRIKGLHEALASTAEEAKEILKIGLQKRTTASTAANHQSSRSHCIFNISTCQIKKLRSADASISLKLGTLTIADLAGFERERKTKNQGVRLNESSFINNTSMVFGQCLRALLEHQKNPKRTLQRHFQYSMLTRYLKPYMEANGNMTLIVNVSPCEEDYVDTAFVLRQVAPYSKLRFNSMPTKENLEGLKVEKRSLTCKESQQPTTKRRKVDGAINGSINVYDFANIRKSQTVMTGDSAKGTVNKSLEVTRMSNEAALPLNTPGDWKANLLAEVNDILFQEGVENLGQVFNAIMKVLDNGTGHYQASEDLKRRLQEQHAELTLLSTNFLKEKQRTFALSSEVEHLKQHCADLEDEILRLKSSSIFPDKDFTPSTSEYTCFATELITQSNAGSQVQALADNSYDRNIDESLLSFAEAGLTKRLSDINNGKSLALTDNHNGLNIIMAQSFEESICELSMISPIEESISEARETVETSHLEIQLPWSEKKALEMSSHVVPAAVCNGNVQEEGLYFCDLKQDSDLDSAALPLTTGAPEIYREAGQATCHQGFEDSEFHEQETASKETLKFSQLNSLLLTKFDLSARKQAELNQHIYNCFSPSTTMVGGDCKLHVKSDGIHKSDKCFTQQQENNPALAFCIHNEQDGRNICDSRENLHLDSTTLPLTVEAQYLHSENHLEGTRERLATCYQTSENGEYHEQQNAEKEKLTIPLLTPMLPISFDSSQKEETELSKQPDHCLLLSTTMVAGHCKTLIRSGEVQQSEKCFTLDHGNNCAAPHLHEASDLKEGHITWNEESGLDKDKDKNSNFQKGKLLALALMQESKKLSGVEADNVCEEVVCLSSSPGSVGLLGPIGHDLEEILEIPLAEFEKDLWVLEARKSSIIFELLAKYCGVLDINFFSKKFSHQRANCLRYCLAVVSGKMLVDGNWVALSEEAIFSRKKHFYAVIQARTVAEAARHARAGFQAEALLDDNVTESEQIETDQNQRKTSASSEKLAIKAQDDKENGRSSSSPISKNTEKSLAAIKRRRLQPLSSLSLHAGWNLRTDLALDDANIDEPKSSHEGRGGTLAYLLTRNHR